MRDFIKDGNLHKYDTTTLKSEDEKENEIYMLRKKQKLMNAFSSGKGKQMFTELDPLIGLSYDQPKKFFGPILYKLNIKKE